MQQEVKANQSAEDEIELIDLIGIIFRHRRLIILFTLSAALFIVVFSIVSLKLPPEKSFLPNVYVPNSTVRINNNGGGSLADLLDGGADSLVTNLLNLSSGQSGYSNAALAVEIGTSRTVVDQIANKFNLMDVYKIQSQFPVTTLRKIIRNKLKIEVADETSTLEISYEDIDRELATAVVNQFVKILEEAFVIIDQNSNRIRMELLEKKIIELGRQMKTAQEDILSFQRANDVLDAGTMATEMTKKLMEVKTQITLGEAVLNSLRERLPREDPRLLLKELEVEELRKMLSALEQGKGSGNLPSIEALPQLIMNFEEKTQLLKSHVEIHTSLLLQYELVKLQQGGLFPTFQVIEYAEIPERKSKPSRGILCMIVTAAAFFFSIFLAFLKEFRDNLRKDPLRMGKLKGRNLSNN